jgi:nucleotide-binding universal stress UspA family protein
MNVLIVALDAAGPLDVGDAEVLVVAPALNSRLRHWLSDDGAARRNAEERAAACVDRLERTGVHAQGRVGDADPLQAIADALPTFAADEIVIAAHPEQSHRLAEELASRARDCFALPVFRVDESFPYAA